MRRITLIAIALLLTKAALLAAALRLPVDSLDREVDHLLNEALHEKGEREEARERAGGFALALHLRADAAIIAGWMRRMFRAARACRLGFAFARPAGDAPSVTAFMARSLLHQGNAPKRTTK